jgi:RimJ/RimL family protein N-acetyltransferase
MRSAYKPIRTERLLLRPIERGDGEGLLPLIRNWNVARWLGVVPWPYEKADMVHFIEEIAALHAATPYPVHVILLGNAPIGTALCRGEQCVDGPIGAASDLGYWLGEPYWGHGYATEAIGALIGRVFSNPEITVIRSGVFEGNEASLNVQRKLGFEVLGTTMAMCRPQARELRHICTRVTRSRFLAARAV